ncbi:MAG: ATP-binding protein [candidate division KSB1 bacterium]|nr:ATP-binding protein [candidate division KSB1 bacterium]MDZ7318770.1 ATP-binding protein [candidate division KSB1 bacterium]MDZ7339853.1 ATP-binding protein [candidate division KSB1 bacterium]
MTTSMTAEERLLKKRKASVRLLVLSTILLLLAFNLGSWLFLRQMDNYLEKELEKRLMSMARLTDRILRSQYIESLLSNNEMDLNPQLFKPVLSDLILKEQLEGAFIIDQGYRVLVDGQRELPLESRRTYLIVDSAAIARAWQGEISVAPSHIVQGNRFKNVYTPIRDISLEVVALLVLEANADFFEILGLFKRGLIIGSLVSFGLMIVFSFFISWMITLLIRTQESLRRSEKLAAMGQMAASVAHEIRNPLGIIKSTADVLKEKYADREQPDELFDYISEEVRRLNHLVNNFLSFAREPKLNLKTANVNEIIQRAVKAIVREQCEQQIAIHITAAEQLVCDRIDEDAMQQVLFNMLINAIQAIAEEGRIDIRLQRVAVKNKEYAQIQISDTGRGIEGDIEKIFEPFYSTKSSGSGLGLTISKQIIEKHGGRIEVASLPGEGTTFRLYLPLQGEV